MAILRCGKWRYSILSGAGPVLLKWQIIVVVDGLFLRRSSIPVFVLIALWLAAGPVAAVVVENLYQADVAVKDHSSRVLQKATRDGLAQVLVKVSGSREVLKNTEVKQALTRNRQYLQRYQYQRLEAGELSLQIHYDSQLVTELLTQAQQPLWTANRPPVLIWLVVDDAAGRHIASAHSHPELVSALRLELLQRGVPAVFPLLDLQDTVALNVYDLWRQDNLAIYRASQRYTVGSTLVGRLSALSNGRWMGDWLYLQESGKAASSFYGEELQAMSYNAINFVAERMAERYAVAAGSGQAEDLLIQVDNLADYAAYRAVIDYLEGIELIDSAYPAYFNGDTMVLRLRAQAEAEQLHRIIALSHRLQRQQTQSPLILGSEQAQLVYRWRP